MRAAPARQRPNRGDSLVEQRVRLARMEPDLQLLIALRAAGWRAEVYSQLHALEALGFLLGHRAETIDLGRPEGGRGQ